MLPPPPSLKTTIIQLNKDIDPDDNNYEILTNTYCTSPALPSVGSFEQPKKKRRRSSSTVDDEELARRRTETKQLHLIIEKRRRVKINREFEALKFIIPACRNSESGYKRSIANSSNGAKIDGMYKLTILKSSVEYIMYLHHIIQRQHSHLKQAMPNYSYDIGYTQVPLDVNQYRNIDKEFDFGALARKLSKSKIEAIQEEGVTLSNCQQLHPQTSSVASLPNGNELRNQLLLPEISPEMAPILSLLSGYKGRQQEQPNVRLSDDFQFQEAQKQGSMSTSISPFTVPIKSQVTRTFYLPDPAEPCHQSTSEGCPRKMMFKKKVPDTNLVANVGGFEMEDTLESASKTLLALKKPSIGRLLN